VFGRLEILKKGKRDKKTNLLLEGEKDEFQVEVMSVNESGEKVFFGLNGDEALQEKIKEGYEPKIVAGKEKVEPKPVEVVEPVKPIEVKSDVVSEPLLIEREKTKQMELSIEKEKLAIERLKLEIELEKLRNR
jgi:hypothetical protein